MREPLFWLGLSLFLVAVSLTAVLIVAIPTLQELSKAANSAEKLFDTLNREFPPTLEAIRLTGAEINELTDELNTGVKSATGMVKQVDRNLTASSQQLKNAQVKTKSILTGAKVAWLTWRDKTSKKINQ